MKPIASVTAGVIVAGVILSMVLPAGAQVVEGFENLKAVKTHKGTLAAVKADGITEGGQAAQLPPGATVELSIDGDALRKAGWLKIDTQTIQPLVHTLKIHFAGDKVGLGDAVCVQAGKDTLAIPVSAYTNRSRNGFGGSKIGFFLTNTGEAGVVIDNIRLEPAAQPPADCQLLDCGFDTQPLWPGFTAGHAGHVSVVWSGVNQIDSGGGNYLDPLSGDFLAPPWYGRWPETFEVLTPTKGPAVAWLYVTHYRRGLMPAMEYGLKVRGKSVLARKLTAAQMLDDDGLLLGHDGAWTPQWLDSTYSGKLCDVIATDLTPGSNKIELNNCQLTAVIMGPTTQKAALTAYMDQVKKDITRYRRQFVLGYRLEPTCPLAMTEDETKVGGMLLAVGPDDFFQVGYKPQDKDRAKLIVSHAYSGGTAVIPFAFVPAKKTTTVSAILSPPKLDGRQAGPANESEVFFLQRVPRLQDARVQFQPFILQPRHGALAPNELLHGVAIIRVSPTAASGVYKGSLRVNFSGGQVEIPIEVAVTNIGAAAPMPGLFGVISNCDVFEQWRSLGETMTEPQQDEISRKLRQQLIERGVNSMGLGGLLLGNSESVRDEQAVRQIKNMPPWPAKGMTIMHAGSVLGALGHGRASPGTKRYQDAMKALVAKVDELARVHKLPTPYVYIDWIHGHEVAEKSAQAADIAAAKGKPMAVTWASLLAGIQGGQYKDQVGPFAAMAVIPNGPTAEQIARFKALGPDRRAFIHGMFADRYAMGFYAAACGADGSLVQMSNMEHGPFDGFATDGAGLAAPMADRSFAWTISMLQFWQAQDDYELYQRCRALVNRAKAAMIDAGELEKLLEAAKPIAAKGLQGYGPGTLRTSTMLPSQMQAYRLELLKSAELLKTTLEKPVTK